MKFPYLLLSSHHTATGFYSFALLFQSKPCRPVHVMTSFNIILPHTTRSSKRVFPRRFPTQTMYCMHLFLPRVLRGQTTSSSFKLAAVILVCEEHELWICSLYRFPCPLPAPACMVLVFPAALPRTPTHVLPSWLATAFHTHTHTMLATLH